MGYRNLHFTQSLAAVKSSRALETCSSTSLVTSAGSARVKGNGGPDVRSVFYRVDSIGSGFLAIMARPRGGDRAEQEFSAFAQAGIRRIISLLELHEEYVLGLEHERQQCAAAKIAFESFPIPDRGVPDTPFALFELSKAIYLRCSGGENTAIHCRAGIGRSSLVAAAVMLHGGTGVDDAFSHIQTIRGVEVPDTPEQLDWLRTHAHTVLTGS